MARSEAWLSCALYAGLRTAEGGRVATIGGSFASTQTFETK